MRVLPNPEGRSFSQNPETSPPDMPLSFLREEKRMAGRALQAWRRSQRTAVPGFEATSLTIAEPGGRAMVLQIAPAIAETFGLTVGQSLARQKPDSEAGIAAELRAACDLVALGGRPAPFEASLIAPDRSVVLVRGVVLPLMGPAYDIETVQVVLSWREVLNRSASSRLRRELGDALRAVTSQKAAFRDPFPIGAKSRHGAAMLPTELHRNN